VAQTELVLEPAAEEKQIFAFRFVRETKAR